MNKIVWVFGNAAVGKETLIRRIFLREATDIQKELGLEHFIVQVVEESIEWVAYEPNHPFRAKRKELPGVIAEHAAKISDSNSVLFIKGQFVDLENKSPEALLALLPDWEHTVIYLHAPTEDMFARLKKKPWFKETFTHERVQNLTLYEINLIKKLPEVIRIQVVESGNDFMYKLVETPSVF